MGMQCCLDLCKAMPIGWVFVIKVKLIISLQCTSWAMPEGNRGGNGEEFVGM